MKKTASKTAVRAAAPLVSKVAPSLSQGTAKATLAKTEPVKTQGSESDASKTTSASKAASASKAEAAISAGSMVSTGSVQEIKSSELDALQDATVGEEGSEASSAFLNHLLQQGDLLCSDRPSSVSQAAKVIDELAAQRPDSLIPLIDKLVHAVAVGSKRAVQTASSALPALAKAAPAKVAKHLPTLTEKFAFTTDEGKNGLVLTFAALCTASVAYQKRLEPVLELALSQAEPKTLQKWTEIILPSLKGEPHARARAVVEERLAKIPRPQAQAIATFLGIKLRPAAKS